MPLSKMPLSKMPLSKMPLSKMFTRLWLLASLSASLCTIELAHARLVDHVARVGWLRAESAHAIVFGNGDQATVLAFTRKLEKFHELLEYMIPGPPDAFGPKLRVYLVRGNGDIRTALPGSDPNLAGQYTASADGIFAIAIARRPGKSVADDVLLHEYTHHFMATRARGSFPAWINEGFAEYFSTAVIEDGRVIVGKPSPDQAYRVRFLRWIGFDWVLTGSPWRMSSEAQSTFYGQSWLLTHYLLDDAQRWSTTQKYLASVGAGVEPLHALKTYFGMTHIELRHELENYASRKIHFSVRQLVLPEPKISITSLPESSNTLMLPSIAMAFGIDDPATLALLRESSTRFPGDAFAIEVAARAALASGEPQQAIDLLAPLLSAQATPEHCYLAGMAHLALANAQQAAASGTGDEELITAANLFAQALKGDENDYRSLFRYWQIRTRRGEPPNARLQDVLTRAYELAPQVSEIGLNTALMLIEVRRAPEARVVLSVLASDPHGSKESGLARRLIALIDSTKGKLPSAADVKKAMTVEDEVDEEKAEPAHG